MKRKEMQIICTRAAKSEKLSGLIVFEKFPFKSLSDRMEQKVLEIPYTAQWKCLFKSFNTVANQIPFVFIGKRRKQINSVT